jgi:hypothetical protein
MSSTAGKTITDAAIDMTTTAIADADAEHDSKSG